MRAVLALMATAGTSRVLAQGYAGEIALGRALFRDKNLSADRTVACISCHQPDHAFADDRPVSFGVYHRPGTRNAPSLLNIGAYRTFFWDGHAPSLRAQVAFPFLAANELGFAGKEEVVARVERNPAYVAAFRRLRRSPGVPLRFADIAQALVAYERSLRARPSPFDRYLAGDRAALSLSARRGLKLFRGKAGCASCHVITTHSAPLTDNAFHSEGVGLSAIGPKVAMLAREAAHRTVAERFRRVESDAPLASLGRYLVTLNPKDIGKFRTPSLKNVALTAPYMHDGSVPTLAQAVDIELYYRGLKLGTPIILSTEDQRDLLAFLRSLSALPGRVRTVSDLRARHPESARGRPE
ncbi:MAG: cytochrome-c peroxidase [Acidiferrobacterales bacterium]